MALLACWLIAYEASADPAPAVAERDNHAPPAPLDPSTRDNTASASESGSAASVEASEAKEGLDPLKAPAPESSSLGVPQRESFLATPEPASAPLLADAEDYVRETALDLDWPLAKVYTSTTLPEDEAALIEAAAQGWVIHVQLARGSLGKLRLRVTAVAPGSQRLEVLVRSAVVDDLQHVLAKLLRQFDPRRKLSEPSRNLVAPPPSAQAAHSPGGAILGGTSAVVGGYFGYALESAAGSDDARLIFPLMAIGASLGFSASLVVAEEWDVSTATAWYLTAGALWAPLSALLIARGTDDDGSNIHVFGPPAAALGIGLTSWIAANQELTAAGALLTHYGSALGAVAGSITQSLIEGEASLNTPLGTGIGAGVGLFTSAALAPVLGEIDTQTVLYSGIGTLLGGLTGAALASPVLVGKTIEPTEQRILLASVMLGMTGGAVAGFIFGHSSHNGDDTAWQMTPTIIPIVDARDARQRSIKRLLVVPGATFTF